MKYPLPSEFTARNYINGHYYNSMLAKIKSIVKNKKLFVIIDESFIQEKKIVVILGGDIEKPHKTYCIDVGNS